MSLIFIVFVCLMQIMFYRLCDKIQKPALKWVLTALLVFANLFLFPRLFFPDEEERIKCGMPQMAITLCFWTIGNSATLLTALVYKFRNNIIT